MLQAKRLKAPKAFKRKAKSARIKIRNMISAGQRPTEKDFDDKWSDFKSVLAAMQHGRCGYCDCRVLPTHDGTVDHYRPKTEINALYDDPSTWGQEMPYSASVTGRKQQEVSDRGYHWLAYAWGNYVFACWCCNTKWKKGFFPVALHPRVSPPRPKGHDAPLLLSCYSKERPSDHLQFNVDGTVEARHGSRYGYETIRTVGLNRGTLCDERKDITEKVFELLGEYYKGDEGALRNLLSMGEARRGFAGVVRAIVEVEMEMTWEVFVAELANSY